MDPLSQLPKEIYRSYVCCHTDVPSIESTQHFVDEMVMFLFPIKANRTVSLKSLQKELRHLKFRLEDLLHPLYNSSEEEIQRIVNDFFIRLPDVYQLLVNDAEVFLNSDPSAKGVEDVIMSFPGFHAITVYRIAHELQKINVPLLPRIMSE